MAEIRERTRAGVRASTCTAAVAVAALTAALTLVAAAAWAQSPFADSVSDNDVPTSSFPGERGTLIIRSGDGLLQTERFRGAHRYDTASLIARHDQNRGSRADSDVAMVARADLFPDTLAGTYLAGQVDAPLLLADRFAGGAGTGVTLDTLDEIGASRVILLGGATAIPEEVEQEFADAGYEVDRVGGADRFDTARLLAGAGDDIGTYQGRRTAFLASGWDFPDALVSGALSYSQEFPVLLTTPHRLHDDARTAIRDHDIEQVIIPGGTSAISQDVANEVAAEVDEVVRLSGPTRVETAIEIARFAESEFDFERDHVNFARADEFPDALALGPHAGLDDSILLLADSRTELNGTALDEFLRDERCDRLYVHIAGGRDAISTEVEDDIREVTTANDEPCQIRLEPEVGRNVVGDPHTVTATVTDNAFTPIPDQHVEFDTDTTVDPARAEPETATATTDDDGEAQFGFVSDEPGEIEIAASAERLDGTPMGATAIKRYALDEDEDFAVDKDVDDAAPEVGDTVTFDVEVTNTSFMPCTVTELVDTLPEGFAYVEDSRTGDLAGTDVSVAEGDADVVTFAFDPPTELAVGESLAGSFAVEITADAPTGVELVNVIDVISPDCDDGHGESPPIEVDEPVEPGEISFELDKQAETPGPGDTARRGETVTYTVRAENTDEITCGVQAIADVMPPGLAYVEDSATGDLAGAEASADDGEQQVVAFAFDPTVALEPGETLEGTFEAVVADDAPLGEAVNEATVVSDVCPDADDTAVVTVEAALEAVAARADGYGARADVGLLDLGLLDHDLLDLDLLGDLLGLDLLGGVLDLGDDGTLAGLSVAPEPRAEVTLPPPHAGADSATLTDLSLPEDTGAVLDVAAASVTAGADLTAGEAQTTSEITDLAVLGDLVEADVIRAVSNSSCEEVGTLADASAGSRFVGLTVAGEEIPVDAGPNFQVDLPEIGEVVVNEVLPDSDGIGFTTRGLRVTLDSGLEAIADVEIVVAEAHSNVVCADPDAGTTGDLLDDGTAGFVEEFVRIDTEADTAEAAAGDRVTYTLTVTNAGAGSGGVFEISDQLPRGFTLVDGSAGGDFADVPVDTESHFGHQHVTFDFADAVPLGAGETIEGTFEATVGAGTPEGDRYHDARVRSDIGPARTGLTAPVAVD